MAEPIFDDAGIATIQQMTEQANTNRSGLSVVIFTSDDAKWIHREAQEGGPGEIARWNRVNDLVDRIYNAVESDRPLGCATCPNDLDREREFMICFIAPAVEDPCGTLGVGICGDCFDAADRTRRIIGFMQKIWPGLEVITPRTADGNTIH